MPLMKTLHIHIRGAVGSVLLAAVLTACSGAGGMPMEQPPQDPKEMLIGTWRTVEDHNPEQDRVITSYVTFTASRYIRYTQIVQDESEYTYRREWGGWDATDTTVTKMPPDDEPDTETWEWVEPGRVLRMTIFRHRDNNETAEYVKVDNPIGKGGIVGGTWSDASADGVLHWSIELGEKLTYRFENTETDWIFELVGPYTIDHSELFINVVIESVVIESREDPLTPFVSYDPGTEIRFAYAPTAFDDSITVSPWERELIWSSRDQKWIDNPENPYGSYWLYLYRD